MNPLHYPSLELCKKLTEIGFPNTMFFLEGTENYSGKIEYNMMPWNKMYDDEYVCPSVMEMLDVMPRIVYDYDSDGDQHKHVLYVNKTQSNNYSVSYISNYLIKENIGTLPNALAEMVLWLVENKHLSFDK